MPMLFPDWTAWRPATCMPDACFCEAVRDGLVRQPANTWSSAAFVVAGALVLRDAAGGSERPSAPATGAAYGFLYAAALILIGAGSAFYHASLTFAGQFVDVFGMYLLGTLVLLHAVSRFRPLSGRAFAALYLAGNLLLAVLLYAVPGLRRYAFAALVLAAVPLELRARSRRTARGEGRLLRLALLALAAGFLVWTLDLLRVLCAPGVPLQGHAAWHLAGAAAAWWFFRYQRAESRDPRAFPPAALPAEARPRP